MGATSRTRLLFLLCSNGLLGPLPRRRRVMLPKSPAFGGTLGSSTNRSAAHHIKLGAATDEALYGRAQPLRCGARGTKRCSEIVLTPSTILERLEIIFPPSTRVEAGERAAARTMDDGKNANGMSFIESVQQTNPPSQAGTTVDGLRACCLPIPWERVRLQRINVSVGAKGQKAGKDGGGCRTGMEESAAPRVLITPAAYNVFIPSGFLFSDSHVVDVPRRGKAHAIMEVSNPMREFGSSHSFYQRGSHGAGAVLRDDSSSATYISRQNGGKIGPRYPVWLQHVAVLHHIPGLPDPGVEMLGLSDFVSGLYQKQETGECSHLRGPLNGECCLARSVAAHIKRKTTLYPSDDGSLKQPASVVNAGVGVWIIRPRCESTFFAVRYSMGTNNYEWLCEPRETLWSQKQETAAAAETSGAAGDRKCDAISSLLWARHSLLYMLRAKPSYNSPRTKKICSLSTVLYYYASGAALTVSEKLFLREQLLGPVKVPPQDSGKYCCAGPVGTFCEDVQHVNVHGASKQVTRDLERRSSNNIIALANVWAPLPRSSYLLRERRLTRLPQALAEEMKYGLIRVFR